MWPSPEFSGVSSSTELKKILQSAIQEFGCHLFLGLS